MRFRCKIMRSKFYTLYNLIGAKPLVSLITLRENHVIMLHLKKVIFFKTLTFGF